MTLKKKYWLAILLIAILSGLLIAYLSGYCPFLNNLRNNNPEVAEGTNVGEQAPDFTLVSLNGEEISLSDYRGKKVFINFWASWCNPCQIEMPDIQKLDNNYDDVVILAVNLREKRGEVAEFLMFNGYTFTTLLDQTGEVANKYLVRGIPTSYVLDEKGIIIGKHTGTMNYDQMLHLLQLD
jgi:thiol-disulfide isomerase/thioredoxin